MPSIDYSRFESVDATSSEEDENEDRKGGQTCTEEGLMRTFVALHERRLEVDDLACKAFASGLTPSLERIAKAYDDVTDRILELDGSTSESSLRSVGHRAEVVKTRLGAARALLAIGDARGASRRADCAVEAMRIPENAELPGAEAAIGESRASASSRGKHLVHADAGQVYLCRAEALFVLESWKNAKEDALMALTAARQRGDQTLAKKAEELALRCEFALHGGGPGLDGEGVCLPADEVDEAFKDLQVGPATTVFSHFDDKSSGSCDEGDKSTLETFDMNGMD